MSDETSGAPDKSKIKRNVEYMTFATKVELERYRAAIASAEALFARDRSYGYPKDFVDSAISTALSKAALNCLEKLEGELEAAIAAKEEQEAEIQASIRAMTNRFQGE